MMLDTFWSALQQTLNIGHRRLCTRLRNPYGSIRQTLHNYPQLYQYCDDMTEHAMAKYLANYILAKCYVFYNCAGQLCFILVYIVIAVSYTHLDVYKRQVLPPEIN